jgi:hypothetical protein
MKTEMPAPAGHNPLKWIAEKSRIVDHARQVADVSDRWFLAVTGGIVNAGDWARREAWIVADSAVAAFATTVDVAKKLSSVERESMAKTPRVAAPGEDEDASAKYACSGHDLDLVAAVRAEGATSSIGDAPRWHSGLTREDPSRGNQAGVVPLLQALGRTVSKHTHAGYASLAEDPRFWTLIHLLQNLGQPSITTDLDAPTPEASEGSP